MTCKSPMASYLLKLEQMVSRTHIHQLFTSYSSTYNLPKLLELPTPSAHARARSKMLENARKKLKIHKHIS